MNIKPLMKAALFSIISGRHFQLTAMVLLDARSQSTALLSLMMLTPILFNFTTC